MIGWLQGRNGIVEGPGHHGSQKKGWGARRGGDEEKGRVEVRVLFQAPPLVTGLFRPGPTPRQHSQL